MGEENLYLKFMHHRSRRASKACPAEQVAEYDYSNQIEKDQRAARPRLEEAAEALSSPVWALLTCPHPFGPVWAPP